MIKSLSDTYKLSNGVEIPCIGFGTYKTPDGEVCAESVRCAIELGYRHIDTAAFYENESGVGEGIRRSGILREDIFVVSKVWNDMQGYENTLRSFDISLKKLGLEFMDMFLVHWPAPKAFRADFPKTFLSTWRALEKLYKDGVVRAIGICNSQKHHIKPLLCECEIAPQVNQIEYHIGCMQSEAEEFSKANGMLVEAWSPLCKGRVMQDGELERIAGKYGKSPAQVLVRWCLQHDVLPLPKSVTATRIKENADVFDFVIEDKDMRILDAFDRIGRLGSNPDTAEF